MIMDDICPSVDVRRFGAKADGKSDDTAAFQAAVDSLENTGGTVLVPPGGVYAIGSKVTIRSRQPVWIKSAVVEKQPGGDAELKDADRAQFRPLNPMECMFEWDVGAGGGGAQGLHICGMGNVNGAPRAERPRMLTAALGMNARSLRVSDCFVDA
jgi:hypothetical protein